MPLRKAVTGHNNKTKKNLNKQKEFLTKTRGEENLLPHQTRSTRDKKPQSKLPLLEDILGTKLFTRLPRKIKDTIKQYNIFPNNYEAITPLHSIRMHKKEANVHPLPSKINSPLTNSITHK